MDQGQGVTKPLCLLRVAGEGEVHRPVGGRVLLDRLIGRTVGLA